MYRILIKGTRFLNDSRGNLFNPCVVDYTQNNHSWLTQTWGRANDTLRNIGLSWWPQTVGYPYTWVYLSWTAIVSKLNTNLTFQVITIRLRIPKLVTLICVDRLRIQILPHWVITSDPRSALKHLISWK